MTSPDAPTPTIIAGQWQYDAAGIVTVVLCDCRHPIYSNGVIKSRVVLPYYSAALCKNCKELVRVPIRFDPHPSP